MRGTTGDVKIHGNKGVQPLGRFRTAGKNTPGDRAGSHGNNNFGSRHGFIGFDKRFLHIARDGTGHDDPVGVTRRGYELNAEPAKIKNRCVKDINVRLAGIAAAR